MSDERVIKSRHGELQQNRFDAQCEYIGIDQWDVHRCVRPSVSSFVDALFLAERLSYASQPRVGLFESPPRTSEVLPGLLVEKRFPVSRNIVGDEGRFHCVGGNSRKTLRQDADLAIVQNDVLKNILCVIVYLAHPPRVAIAARDISLQIEPFAGPLGRFDAITALVNVITMRSARK